MELNAEQIAAIEHRSGPSVTLAGPGAGKTSVITEKFAYLLRRGERPDHILCTTFSVEAAHEMRRRIAKLTGFTEKTLKDSVSTFHSLGYRIVVNERFHLGWKLADRPVLDRGEDRKILRDFIRRDKIADARRYIGMKRRELITPEAAFQKALGTIETEMAQVYFNYDEALREQGMLDFDSMVYWAVKVLERSQDSQARWQEKFRHVIIDEAHDTSPDQKKLAELLSAKHANLCAVGDPSQSIYGWRGSTTEMLTAETDGKKMFFLGVNHRSGSEIIEAFKPFAEKDELSRKLVSVMRSANGDRGSVIVRGFLGEYEQARAAIEELCAFGAAPDDCAVLARTKAVLLPYCELLEERGIQYRWRGRSFWLASEIQDALAFCKFALVPADRESFLRAVCSGAQSMKFLGRKFAEAVIRAFASERKTSPMDVSRPEGNWENFKLETWERAAEAFHELRRRIDARPADFLRLIQTVAGLSFYDSQTEEPDDFSRENFEALVLRAERFLTLHEFVEHATKMASQSRSDKGVTLSTIHSAKGLEWNLVFVVGVTDKVLPHARSMDQDEERRIMYVALSRARKFLWISWHGDRSPFIDMLPEKILRPERLTAVAS